MYNFQNVRHCTSVLSLKSYSEAVLCPYLTKIKKK